MLRRIGAQDGSVLRGARLMHAGLEEALRGRTEATRALRLLGVQLTTGRKFLFDFVATALAGRALPAEAVPRSNEELVQLLLFGKQVSYLYLCLLTSCDWFVCLCMDASARATLQTHT